MMGKRGYALLIQCKLAGPGEYDNEVWLSIFKTLLKGNDEICVWMDRPYNWIVNTWKL